MANYKNIIYAFTCLSFAIVIGGAVYEHTAVAPLWSAAPPKSLAMFQGEFGLKADRFWKMIHPITLLLFIATLIAFWKSVRRKNILVALVGYVAILAVTTVYFVPELLSIIESPYSDQPDAGLTARAQMWVTLSLVRLAVLVFLSVSLFLGLAKPVNLSLDEARVSPEYS